MHIRILTFTLIISSLLWISDSPRYWLVETAHAATTAAPTLQDGQFPNSMRQSTSPSGLWRADVQDDLPGPGQPVPDEYYTKLSVTSTDGQVTHIPIAATRRYGLGLETPAIIRWSPDESYLYYSEQVHADGCAPFTYLSGLWRLNLQNGQIDELLAESRTLSLSPSTRFLIFDHGKQGLRLNDLETGHTQSMQSYTRGRGNEIITVD